MRSGPVGSLNLIKSHYFYSMDKNNQIKYYLIHCEEHNERLPHIQNIRWTVDQNIEIFTPLKTEPPKAVYNLQGCKTLIILLNQKHIYMF